MILRPSDPTHFQTAGQLHALLLMLMLYPEIRKKAQAEIDHVVGPERLPHFSDRDKLPYVEACLTEAFRLHTLSPTGKSGVCPAFRPSIERTLSPI